MSSPAATPAANAPQEEPALFHGEVEVDPVNSHSGSDSAYTSDSIPSDTTSITSSIKNYTYSNGRRYHSYDSAAARYLLPNDETEQDRLDLAHHSALLLLKGDRFTAPLKNPQRILDCGTGTGIWALEVGDMFPSATVTGVDLAPIQPTWTAPNVKFEVDDLEQDWTWKEGSFDFVHSRTVGAGIKDWSKYVKQMYKVLQPGGLVEIGEHNFDVQCDDGTYNADTKLWNYVKNYYDPACARLGVNLPELEEIRQKVEDAGFVDITVKRYKYPWGPWAKDKDLKMLGAVSTLMAETGFEAYGMEMMTKALGATPEEVREVCAGAVSDLKSKKVHAYMIMWYIVARKPTEEEA